MSLLVLVEREELSEDSGGSSSSGREFMRKTYFRMYLNIWGKSYSSLIVFPSGDL
jgi:hypothetical protein